MSPVAAAGATWLFALGVLSNLVIGRMPFTLGIALAVGAWACAERDGWWWRAGAVAAALGSVLASPVAGLFLLLAAVARLAGGRPELPRAAVLALPVLLGGAALAILFPEGGSDRFVASAFWPMLIVSIAGVALLAPGHRSWRIAGALYLVLLAAAFAIPSPFGQNALRLPVLLGPAALLLAPRAGVPALAKLAVGGVLVYLAWLPAVRAVDEAHGDPSTSAAFWEVPREFFAHAARPGERVEVAFTRNHWEAAYLATAVELARGWERQLDEKANPIFYDGRALTPSRYHDWLRSNAVRWVALPDAPLDYSARAEAQLVGQQPPFLRLAHSSPGWKIYEVADTDPPASDGARVTAAGPNGFDVVTTARPTVVRQRFTPYWRSDGACVTRTPDGWTRVAPARAGAVQVRARFRLGRDGRGCSDVLSDPGQVVSSG